MANSTPITIKKYANRRLYNTASSAYVTLADLAKMVKAGENFIVYDAKTNEDITRSVLTQIIFEQEGIEGQSLLPTTFLRQLIGFYGDSMQAILPSYLEFSIDRFSGEQQAMREAASRMFGPEAFSAGSFAALQELTKKNFAAFNQALAMFSPFAGATPATELAAQEGEFRGRHRRNAQSAVRHAKAPRVVGQKDRDALKSILARTKLREHRRRLRPRHAHRSLNRRLFHAQKRIGGKLGREGCRQCGASLGAQPCDLVDSSLQNRIVGFDRGGEPPVGLGVFVAAVNLRLARKGRELHE